MNKNLNILLLDNYDSFTYNIVDLIHKVGCTKVDVIKNDEIELNAIEKYDKIILSPGPGLPAKAGITLKLIKQYYSSKPILGICLGHQAIAEAFGCRLKNLKTVFHGVSTTCNILLPEAKLLKGLKNNFIIGRYHSWVVDKNNFSNDLEVTAIDDNGYVMALQHKTLNIHGVQFHPESILTPNGKLIIENFLEG